MDEFVLFTRFPPPARRDWYHPAMLTEDFVNKLVEEFGPRFMREDDHVTAIIECRRRLIDVGLDDEDAVRMALYLCWAMTAAIEGEADEWKLHAQRTAGILAKYLKLSSN